MKGYDYFDQSQFERVNFESEKELLIAVSNGVVKQGIIAKKSAMYWSKVLNQEVIFGATHSKAPLVFRMHKHLKPYKHRIDSAIDQVKRDGTLERIIYKYINE
ncbi:hypothetical protein B9G39_19650 [Zooshikella ganghwensis]|uniref:Uncharacterized protein n=1 Tax=Zooshikella ganghwensis TaxID=202772 RepID=A0A4V1INZ8_9GAMM|nr:hypothetical protein B9G39_19650 [Zooshikella ganghwensis]